MPAFFRDPANWLPTLILTPLVGFLLYRRYKRTFGPQTVKRRSMMFRVGFLSIVAVLILVTSHAPIALVAAAIGLALGAALGVIATRHTTFERKGAETIYTTKPWIGLVVSALFLGRLGARFLTLQALPHDPGAGPPKTDFGKSPLTLGIFFLVVAYYVVFYVSVLRRDRALTRG